MPSVSTETYASGSPTGLLVGRGRECRQLDDLVGGLRKGEGRSLVLRGEPGTGKSALLEYLVVRARSCQVVRITGVRAESDLEFAGLHSLCLSVKNRAADLPAVQRYAVNTVLGLSDPDAVHDSQLALGILGLLSDLAHDQPLLCVVDDAQWLDRSSRRALGFAARRLLAESVAIVIASRPSATVDDGCELAGLPEMPIEALTESDAQILLGSSLAGTWDERVLARVVAESRGNPRALLELQKATPQLESAGGYGIPSVRRLSETTARALVEQIAGLPPEPRQLLLVAATEPTGDPTLLWRASDQLGIGLEAAACAEAAGLITIDDRVRFANPMLRPMIYWAASDHERRRTHRALASIIEPATDPDRHAWHTGRSATGPNEAIAAELVRTASHARRRGGTAAAAAFLARAAELTPQPADRASRALDAARIAHDAGDLGAALRLLSIADAGNLDERRRMEVELTRARICFLSSGRGSAAALLLKAAHQLAHHDPALARNAYLEAIGASLFADSRDVGREWPLAAAEAARRTPAKDSVRPADLLLDGFALHTTEGSPIAVPTLRRAVRAAREQSGHPDEGLLPQWLTGLTALGLWDAESALSLADSCLRRVRESEQIAMLPLALTLRGMVHVLDGELAEAASAAAEITTVSDAVGSAMPPYVAVFVAAWRGHEAECVSLSSIATSGTEGRGDGFTPMIIGWAKSVLYNGLGRCREAAEAAYPAVMAPGPLRGGVPLWPLVEYIEATVRLGAPEQARDALKTLTEMTEVCGTPWATGIEARCNALLTEGAEAESNYLRAIDSLGRTTLRGELARTHLLYGEWLRRGRRRRSARSQLHTAHEMFTELAMAGFADRAARELAAAGEGTRRRADHTQNVVTAQEAQIVRLIREGLSNAEIGARLFISPRTVEWHVSKVFVKLGVTSRKQLQTKLHHQG